MVCQFNRNFENLNLNTKNSLPLNSNHSSISPCILAQRLYTIRKNYLKLLDKGDAIHEAMPG